MTSLPGIVDRFAIKYQTNSLFYVNKNNFPIFTKLVALDNFFHQMPLCDGPEPLCTFTKGNLAIKKLQKYFGTLKDDEKF